MTKTCNLSIYVKTYIDLVESEKIRTCKEQKLLCALVKNAFETEDIYCDDALAERYLSLQKFFPYTLFDWEKFCFVLRNCVFIRGTGMLRWPDLFICVGRGSGKNGYLSFEDFCLLSHYHGIKKYHIEICATSEDQARTSFDEIISVLENNRDRLMRYFTWNQERIINKITGSVLRYRTNAPKTKDSLRSGKVDFDEVHMYEDYSNIDVYTGGLGKVDEPRRTFLTTNGNVRDGVLDDMLKTAEAVLNGVEPDNGTLYFIGKLDDAEEVHDERNWEKAIPSIFLYPKPTLLTEVRREYTRWKNGNTMTGMFMSKRMNIPQSDAEIAVTDFDNLRAASRELPALAGASCVCGIDFSKRLDFSSVGLLFRIGEERYWITHSWVCRKSPELGRIKAPLEEWAAQQLLTWVDDIEISPDDIADWIADMARTYNIKCVTLDNFRYAILSKALKKIGFDAKENKNVYLVRPSDLMIIYPIVTSMFNHQQIAWGDPTMMRWYTNNSKAIAVVKRGSDEADLGNMTFGKIEPKSRKTDGFFALLAAMTKENELDAMETGELAELPVLVC